MNSGYATNNGSTNPVSVFRPFFGPLCSNQVDVLHLETALTTQQKGRLGDETCRPFDT